MFQSLLKTLLYFFLENIILVDLNKYRRVMLLAVMLTVLHMWLATPTFNHGVAYISNSRDSTYQAFQFFSVQH